MEFKKMPIKLFTKKIIRTASQQDNQKFEDLVAKNPHILEEYNYIQKIWQEAGKLQIFEQFDTESDWKFVSKRIDYAIPVNYHKIPLSGYFLRIAALLVLTFGLSIGFYRIIISLNKTEADFNTQTADNKIEDLILPDGSTVSLNAGSSLSYRGKFGDQSREVILDGEALFNVKSDVSKPFKVYIGESVVEVTGTQFSVRETEGAVKVSVLSGTVLLSSATSSEKKIKITANHSGYLLTNNELKLETGISANTLSWKTGHLVFDQTPIDSALMDIARHFRKELSFETPVVDEITAEFQDQPLYEILDELKLVAGLQFDTTGMALIVRK